MKLRTTVISLVSIFASFLFVLNTAGQGVVVPIICDIRPCRPRPIPPRPIPPRPVPLPNVLPVKSIKLDTKINGQVATTHVEQVFRNDTPHTLEGTYFFPIPETASIVEFAIWENGKKLVGEVRTREEARRIYNEIVRSQRDPGLLEYAGKDLFQASIFPIPPHSDKKLEITYSQTLKAESGTVAYRYPLGTGRNLWAATLLGQRKVAGTPQKFGTVSGTIEITGRNSLRNIYSPSHDIDVKNSGGKATVSFEAKDNSNDLQLFYGLSEEDFGMSLVTYREPGKDGYFMLLVSPKDDISERDVINKDVVFVLDTSGSMADEGKMDKARAALLFGIRGLRQGDRFNVISFAGEERLMERALVNADQAGKKRGEEFVNRLRPSGGTNINDAVRAGIKQFDSSERPKMMVFLTDGLPTVGETRAEKIVENAQSVKVKGLRMFTFGVGYDVNTLLLDKLAGENSGLADYIEPKEDIEIKVSNFFTKVNSPVLTDIEIDLGGLRTDLVYPRKFGDIFKGMQLSTIGRYTNDNDLRNLTLKLSGRSGRDVRTFRYSGLDFPLRAETNEFLPRLWATRRVGWLVEQIRSVGESKELRDEVVELGTRYGIVTPYTSYLATDGSETRGRVIHRTPRPGGFPPAKSSPVISSISGADAVTMSKKANEQKNKSVLNEADEEALGTAVKKAGLKTFYLSNGVWVDSEFREDAKLPETKLVYGSDSFFQLIADNKDIAQYLAVGEEVVLVYKGRVYRVGN